MNVTTLSFSKSSVSKMFSVHTKTQSRRFQIPSVCRGKNNGLERTVGLTVEIKLRFQIPLGLQREEQRIREDGRSNRRNKTPFSNSSRFAEGRTTD